MAPFNARTVEGLGKRGSPLQNRLSTKAIKKSRKRNPPGWYIRSVFLAGNIELIFITQSNYTNDAYFQPLVIAIRDGTHNEIENLNVLGAFVMHEGLSNNSVLYSPRSGYPRKAFVRILEEDETTPEKRKEGLQIIKRFLEHPDNNRYSTNVFIPDNWDITPAPPADLRKLDYYLEYDETVKVIRALFDGVDHHWAVDNPISANAFFTAGHIPYQAHSELGFLREEVVPVGVVPPFPHPSSAINSCEEPGSKDENKENASKVGDEFVDVKKETRNTEEHHGALLDTDEEDYKETNKCDEENKEVASDSDNSEDSNGGEEAEMGGAECDEEVDKNVVRKPSVRSLRSSRK